MCWGGGEGVSGSWAWGIQEGQLEGKVPRGFCEGGESWSPVGGSQDGSPQGPGPLAGIDDNRTFLGAGVAFAQLTVLGSWPGVASFCGRLAGGPAAGAGPQLLCFPPLPALSSPARPYCVTQGSLHPCPLVADGPRGLLPAGHRFFQFMLC